MQQYCPIHVAARCTPYQTHLIYASYQHILSTHLIYASYQHTLSNTPYLRIISAHPINTPYLRIILAHPINTPYLRIISAYFIYMTFSTHPINPPSQHSLSTHHPINTPSQHITPSTHHTLSRYNHGHIVRMLAAIPQVNLNILEKERGYAPLTLGAVPNTAPF